MGVYKLHEKYTHELHGHAALNEGAVIAWKWVKNKKKIKLFCRLNMDCMVLSLQYDDMWWTTGKCAASVVDNYDFRQKKRKRLFKIRPGLSSCSSNSK